MDKEQLKLYRYFLKDSIRKKLLSDLPIRIKAFRPLLLKKPARKMQIELIFPTLRFGKISHRPGVEEQNNDVSRFRC